MNGAIYMAKLVVLKRIVSHSIYYTMSITVNHLPILQGNRLIIYLSWHFNISKEYTSTLICNEI